MQTFLIIAFLFWLGSSIGWILELFYRKFFSSGNPDHKWINPGFCVGPYLPLYGTGVCILYGITVLFDELVINPHWAKNFVTVFVMAILMTAIEFLSGWVSLKYYHVRLWDYRELPGNIEGLICPLFSFFWGCLSAFYLFWLHSRIADAVSVFQAHTYWMFALGVFYGIFIVDVNHSLGTVNRLKKFAEENNVIIRYENLKASIRRFQEEVSEKSHFLAFFRSEKDLLFHLNSERAQEFLESVHDRIQKAKEYKNGLK